MNKEERNAYAKKYRVEHPEYREYERKYQNSYRYDIQHGKRKVTATYKKTIEDWVSRTTKELSKLDRYKTTEGEI